MFRAAATIMRRMPIPKWLVATSFVCLFPISGFAQAVSLAGRVGDPQGGAVVGAVVTLSAAGGAAARTARTGVDGTFFFDGTATGSYTLQVESPGFQPAAQEVRVEPGIRPLDVVLQIAGVVETLIVAAPRLEEELPQQIERSGVRVQTITGAQLENGGYYDVAQALQSLVPGLFLSPQSGPFDYVASSLQGSRGNEILWLVDGVRISNRLYNGTSPLDTIPAHMVERVEILEGGQGLFYGTQAVGGVINVVTKSFSQNADGRVQGGFDSNDGKHLNAFARNTFGAGHRVVVYGSSDRAPGFENFPASEYSGEHHGQAAQL